MEEKKSYQFSVDRKKFLESLDTVWPAIERTTTIPILANVLIEVVQGGAAYRMTATDLELALISEGPCHSDITPRFAFTVGCKQLRDTLKAMDAVTVCFSYSLETVEKEIEDYDPVNQVTVKKEIEYTVESLLIQSTDGKEEFTLNVLPADDFPMVPGPEKSLDTEIDKASLLACLEKTFFAIPLEDNRYALTGALFEISEKEEFLRIVTTDTHRLSLADCPEGIFPQEMTAIIPRKALSQVMAISKPKHKVFKSSDSWRFGLEGNHAFFKIGNLLIISRILEGEFPSYQKVLESKPGDITADLPVKESLKALKKTSLYASERSHAVNLEFNSNHVLFSVNNPCSGSAKIKVMANIDRNGSGDVLERFNSNYLSDVLSIAAGDSISLSLYDKGYVEIGETEKTESWPVYFREEKPVRFEHIVMPMRF